MRQKGFTLIELLVVIAIIALLLSILIPALSIAKRKAQGVICLTNQSTLAKAWFTYAADNEDKLPSPSTPLNPHSSTKAYWACVPQDENGDSKASGSTIEEKIIGIKRGVIYPYVLNPKAYHCPGDHRYKKAPVNSGYGGIGAYRSYSMVGSLVNGGIMKQTQIMSPDSMYVFVEESDGRGYNMNSWVIYTNKQQWIDPISIWHGNSSTLAFADSHGEIHKWYGEGTKKMSEDQTFWFKPDPADTSYQKDLDDLLFMQKGYPRKKG